jgi:hypothetical protein
VKALWIIILALILGFATQAQTVMFARSAAFRFNPTNNSSLKLWLVGDNESAGSVGTWDDLSGNGNNATQADSAQQPTAVTNVVNGHTVLRADGTSDQMSIASNPLTGASGGTLVVVFKQDADPPSVGANTGGGPISRLGSDAATPGDHWPWTDGNIYDGSMSTARKTVGNPTTSLASWAVISIVSAASDYRFYINGTLFYSTASNTVGFSGSAPLLFWSTDSGGGIYYFKGDVAEVLAYNRALSTTERQAAEDYAGTKYGITITH